MLSQSYVREMLIYDEHTGMFVWRVRPSRSCKAGSVAGKDHNCEGIIYRVITLRRRGYFAHRLAWLYVFGEWPKGSIDHINNIGIDNRIANLRLASPSQNNANQRKRQGTSSKLKGVTWHKKVGKWQAAIKVAGKNKHLGLFTDEASAHAAYVAEAKRVYGDFMRPA